MCVLIETLQVTSMIKLEISVAALAKNQETRLDTVINGQKCERDVCVYKIKLLTLPNVLLAGNKGIKAADQSFANRTRISSFI
jgi:hypothetical protein